MRDALFGFLLAAGVVLVLDVLIMLVFGLEGRIGTEAWWIVNFPSIPCLLCCMGPPPMGEAEITGWDYMAVLVSLFGSCVTWGLLGAFVGWLGGRGLPGKGDTQVGGKGPQGWREAGDKPPPEADAAAGGPRP